MSSACEINPKTGSLDNQFLYIDLESVVKGSLVKRQIIEKDGAPSRAQRVLKENDILYQCVRPYQLNNYIFEGDTIQCVASTGYAQLRTTQFPLYIFQALHTKQFTNQVLERCTGTNYPAINSSDLGTVEVPICSLPEQVKIGSLLALIDSRIKTQSKIIEELKTLRGALVDTYINDGNNNNENQTIMSLGAYGCFVRGLTYSSVDVTDNTATTGVVRSNNLEYGSPVDIKTDLVYVTKKPSPEQMLVNGDIVICMANGSSSLVGKASNYQELCRNMTVGAFCGIYRGTHPLTKWIFMSSAYCKAVANAIQGGNGAIANLHAEDILSMCFAVPSDYKTITELGKLLSLFDEKLHAAEEQLARFIEQKKYFLFKMFI